MFVCDDVPYIKPIPAISELMQGADLALPWATATREWYIVDIDNSQLLYQVVNIVASLTSVPKTKPNRVSQFATNVYNMVQSIPHGKVTTYTQIAILIGNPRAARAVSMVLYNNTSCQDIPCHRVVDSKGQLASSFALGGIQGQRHLLQIEGVQVAVDRVDLDKFGWCNYND
jgi:O-6-methylguanine DNA methyltransferase